jgi:ferrochelatase
MEVLYDLDVEASAVARELGMEFIRAGSAGLHPAMVRMFGELVRERTEGVKTDWCAPDCCPAPRRGR